MNKFSRKGFTLIELMIVVSIITIMAVIGGASYISSLRRSRDARRMADLEQVRAALEMYRTDNSGYPSGDYDAMYTELNIKPYLTKKPVDPGTNDYYYWTDGSAYQLCAKLENSTPATCTKENVNHNYGVDNP